MGRRPQSCMKLWREWTPAVLLSAKQQDSNLPGREAESLSRKAEQRPGGIRRQGKAGEMPKCGHWEPVKRPYAGLGI